VGGESDNELFARIVVPHLGEALTLARWLTGNRADAEDVVQEACVRALRAIGGYGGGSARSWVLAIVRNTARTWLTTRARARLVAVDDLREEEILRVEQGGDIDGGRMTTPEADMIAKADAAGLDAAISALPADFRETLVLRDLQGLAYREIAEVTGAPVGTVMSRLARGRQHLLRTLKADDA
jgi:RNA polymerase sigma-70 factor (ECF subfamily)